MKIDKVLEEESDIKGFFKHAWEWEHSHKLLQFIGMVINLNCSNLKLLLEESMAKICKMVVQGDYNFVQHHFQRWSLGLCVSQ